MRRAALILLVYLSFAQTLTAATATIYRFSLTRRSRLEGGKIARSTNVVRLYRASDGRIRQEMISGDGTFLVELFGVRPSGAAAPGMYILDPKKKIYYPDTKSGLRPGPPPTPHIELSTDLGNKRLQGLACHGQGGTGSAGERVEMWQCQFPGTRMTFVGELTQNYPDGTGEHLSLTAITENTGVPELLFEIPENFREAKGPQTAGKKETP